MPRSPVSMLSYCLDEFADQMENFPPLVFGPKVPEFLEDDGTQCESLETIAYIESSAKQEDSSSETGKKEEPANIEQMTTRELRKLCKEKGLKVRGVKKDILMRLKRHTSSVSIKSPEYVGTEQSFSENEGSEDGSFNADPELETSSSSGGSEVALTAEALESFESHLIAGDRPLRVPDRYTPSNSVVDDDDSDGNGISVDSDLDACQLSSDSSRARSIVHAIQKRRRL